MLAEAEVVIQIILILPKKVISQIANTHSEAQEDEQPAYGTKEDPREDRKTQVEKIKIPIIFPEGILIHSVLQ